MSRLIDRGPRTSGLTATPRRSRVEPRRGGGGVGNSQVTAVSFDAFGGAEAFAVVGVAHAGVAVTLAGWKRETGKRVEKKKQTDSFCGGGPEPCGSFDQTNVR